MRVKSIQGDEAVVESGGLTYKASIQLTPGVKEGDYVLLHTGYAISIIDQQEAEEIFETFKEMDNFSQNDK
jgi:hydrogenase expression/formation protein HypC